MSADNEFHTVHAVHPNLVKLFGRLVEPGQLLRWRQVRLLEKWPRFELGYTRRVRVSSIEKIVDELRTLGAHEPCVAITLQGSEFAVSGSLEELVRAVCLDQLEWDGETAQNAIVVCNPGHLAFSKDDYGTYAIYHRP